MTGGSVEPPADETRQAYITKEGSTPPFLSNAHRRMLFEESGISPEIVAALAYAARGIPVFPCKPGGKAPLTPNGHLAATTAERQIRGWWTRWPNANIGVPTGPESGILALDVDAHGFTSLDALEEEHGELHRTATTRTGGGGMHHLFGYPAGETVRNSAGKLGVGLDVRGAGGYIIAPPSATEGPYEWLDKAPLVDPPEWLLELLRGPSRGPGDPTAAEIGAENYRIRPDKQGMPSTEATGGRLSSAVAKPGEGVAPSDLGPIAEGRRNGTLASIAGKLRARGHDQAEILKALAWTNRVRCEPPLPEAEVEGVARSVARYPAGVASGGPGAEALEVLDRINAGIEATTWAGSGGKTRRDTMVSALKAARLHGRLLPCGGVRLSIGVRPLAWAAGKSKNALTRRDGALDWLRRQGMLRRENAERTGAEAGAFVLMPPEAWAKPPSEEAMRAVSTHSTTGRVLEGGEGGSSLRAPYTAPRLRHTAPRFDRAGDQLIRTTIRRLGPAAGQAVDILECSGGALGLEELYGRVYPDKDPADRKRWRPRDLRRRSPDRVGVVARLEDAGVAECDGRTVRLCADWLEALNREREICGETAAARRDMARYDRESEAFRNRGNTRPEHHPGNLGADGYIEDLRAVDPEPEEEPPEQEEEGAEVSELARAIRGYLDRSPADACQPPGWIGVTLWAHDLYPGPKPTPAEVRAAVEELGGERYLRDSLCRAAEEAA